MRGTSATPHPPNCHLSLISLLTLDCECLRIYEFSRRESKEFPLASFVLLRFILGFCFAEFTACFTEGGGAVTRLVNTKVASFGSSVNKRRSFFYRAGLIPRLYESIVQFIQVS